MSREAAAASMRLSHPSRAALQSQEFSDNEAVGKNCQTAEILQKDKLHMV